MAINFPDPAGQTPENEFSPTSTPSATTNGVTYTWDGDKWVGTAGGSGSTYWDRNGNQLSPATVNDEVKVVVDTDGDAGLSVYQGDDLRIGMFGNGSARFGGTTADTTSILGKDGQGEFKKHVITGDDALSNTVKTGVKLFEGGIIHQYRNFSDADVPGTPSSFTALGIWDDIPNPGASLNAADANVLFTYAGRATFKGQVIAPGSVINIQQTYDAGGSTTSATFNKINADYIRYNPVSEDSTIYWSVTAQAQTLNLDGYNTYGHAQVNANTNLTTDKTFGSPSSAGGTGWQGTWAEQGSFVNSGNNQKLFSINAYSQVSGATSTVFVRYQNWTIIEVQN